ncbi:MAG: hypothetical protein V7K67_30115 [Nostoc sp.]|uniref:hypothetical protein n=1 Tax=Nostoc sp. TaxID=1180 RepID=UPI002FF945DC
MRTISRGFESPIDSAAKPLSSPLALASPNVIRGDAKSERASRLLTGAGASPAPLLNSDF